MNHPQKSPNKPQQPQQVFYAAEQSFHLGPLPPPDELIKYNQAHPGAADRVIKMAELEQAHRHECDKTALQGELEERKTLIKTSQQGQWLAALVALVLILCGTYTISNSHDWAGATIITTCLVGLVTSFIVGKNRGKKLQTIPDQNR